MPTQNNNTLPNIFVVVEIVYYIAQFSEITETIALARTCKLLYNYIIKCNGFWKILYQQRFPRNINTDVDWLQWQLTQKPRITESAANMENKTTSKLTWFQLYSQRINLGINWQNNKSTSIISIKSTMIDNIINSGTGRNTITASYPGWIAIADRYNPSVDLIEILTNNTVKNRQLKLGKDCLKMIKNIAFYQCQQVNNIDEDI
ncbi:hypothetical protein BDF19DRAFT_451627 [Syncephalis fuscata]|nr:hypothetical protein BDF19DRAFT_451627 [Syncephalis fuscata]